MKFALAVLCASVALAGCTTVADTSDGPAPAAFTDCMRHFTDNDVVGPDAEAASQVCAPFTDEDNEAVQRLADKHFD